MLGESKYIVMVGLDPTIPGGTNPRNRAVCDPRIKSEDDDFRGPTPFGILFPTLVNPTHAGPRDGNLALRLDFG